MTDHTDLIENLRSKINPAYADVIGTESYERKVCLDAIEALVEERDALNTAYAVAIKAAEGWQLELAALRAAIEAVEKVEPDGYIEIEIYDGIQDFGFAASFEQGVLDHIKDKVLRLIDEEITVPEMHVKPFYLNPPSAEIRKDAEQPKVAATRDEFLFWFNVTFHGSGVDEYWAYDMCQQWAKYAAMQEKQP